MPQSIKLFRLAIVSVVLFSACEKNCDLQSSETMGTENTTEFQITDVGSLTDNVIIGKKLDNPYSLKNMKQACDKRHGLSVYVHQRKTKLKTNTSNKRNGNEDYKLLSIIALAVCTFSCYPSPDMAYELFVVNEMEGPIDF